MTRLLAVATVGNGMERKVTRFEVRDRVATLTLYRPDRLNSWTGRMHAEYRHALEQAESDPGVGIVVVTGAGRGFCAGADARALESHRERGGYDAGTPEDLACPGYGVRSEFDADFAFQFGLTKPVIAAINGPAAGVGLVLACYADLRFAVPGAKLTTAHGRLHLPAEYGLSWLLPRLIGLARANELLLSSRVFMTDEAFEMGLVNGLFSAEELLPRVHDYAVSLIESISPGSLSSTKRQIYTDLHRDVGSSVKEAQERLDRMTTEADFREAVSAWLEKRHPDWRKG